MKDRLKNYLELFQAQAARDTEAGHALLINGKVKMVTPNMLEWFDYSLDEALGRGVLEFTAPESHEALRQYVFSGSQFPARMTCLRRDGSRMMFDIIGTTVSEPEVEGELVRIVQFRKA